MLQLDFFVRHYIKKKKKSIIQSIILWNMNLKSSQINCDRNKNVFYTQSCTRPCGPSLSEARGGGHRHMHVPSLRVAAELKNRVQRQMTVFFWESDSGSPPGPTAPTPRTSEREGRPLGSPPAGEHSPDFTCLSGPAPLADAAGSREPSFRKVP